MLCPVRSPDSGKARRERRVRVELDAAARDRTVGVMFLFLPFWVWVWFLERGESEGKTYGKNVIVPVLIRLCPNCRQALRPSLVLAVLFQGKYAIAAVGIVLLFFWSAWGVFWSAWGATLLAAALFLWLLEKIGQARRQRTILDLLRRVPVYSSLLDKYPDARIMLAD